MKKFVILIAIILISSITFAQFRDYNVLKEVKVKNKGVVASAFPLASEAGVKMLREGGNAFDAMIATQFALAVTHPQAGNIGGGGFTIATTVDGKRIALDYREKAPGKADRDMFLDDKGDGNLALSQNGGLASGVPGAVAGIFKMHEYAKLPMAKLIQPAIDLAELGFALSASDANTLNYNKEAFLKFNKNPIPFVKEGLWIEGDILIQKDLAETLKRIQKEGQNGFYRGETAKLIVLQMKESQGIISKKDLKNYEVREREPLVIDYRGHEVITMPLPSGGLVLAQLLKMVDLIGLEGLQLNSPEAVQLMLEVERRVFADRAEYMGDPDFINDQTEMLLSNDYLKNRMANYDPDKATPSSEVGKVENLIKESEETTHISVLDKEGNAVSTTTTLNGGFGSKVVVSGAGFFLNNEMDDFSIKPGVPNMYGALGGKANAIEPNKRMLSAMSPTIVLKEGSPRIVVGTPGGTTIPTQVFQSIVNVIDFGANANIAVNGPKFHHQWLPDTVQVESDFPETTVKILEDKGYVFVKRNKIGRVEMIVVDGNGNYHAVADGRGDDSVAIE
ncbi:gamma-glutamyltransferase [Gelidibacter sp.]|uniref:gamma-glutamyltransferase n=1 Tax=Gelidibacter sp. TaxID=2018083 RepID=UPI002B9575AD|nr:gamma-glutamyltransferase [Gelidibacter sp.]HUH27507.1 gamma-glutamyltransferase [Gelidibacter sp.]